MYGLLSISAEPAPLVISVKKAACSKPWLTPKIGKVMLPVSLICSLEVARD